MLVTRLLCSAFGMKMTAQNTSKPAEQPVFHKDAENLYRLESSGAYYALIKKSGKQFRRSLKTKDRKLADRRLKELKGQIGCLTLTDDAKAGLLPAMRPGHPWRRSRGSTRWAAWRRGDELIGQNRVATPRRRRDLPAAPAGRAWDWKPAA